MIANNYDNDHNNDTNNDSNNNKDKQYVRLTAWKETKKESCRRAGDVLLQPPHPQDYSLSFI